MGPDFKRNILGGARSFALSVILFASGCATTISGSIKKSDAEPLEDATINLSYLGELSGKQTYSAPISSEGEYEVSGKLPDGEYLLEVLIPGYEYTSKKLFISGSKKIDLPVKRITKSRQTGVGANEELPYGRGAGRANLNVPNL